MKIKDMPIEELELMSLTDITYIILKEKKKSLSTAELFKEISKLLDLSESDFASKIGDYYTSLVTDKRFILLEDGTWDLRSRHTSDKVVKVADNEDDEDEDEEEAKEEEIMDDIEEDNYDDDNDDDDVYDDSDDDLKDLVIIDEDELELEE